MTMTTDIMKDGSGGLPITKNFLEKVLKRKILTYKVGEGSNPGDNFTSILFSLEVNLMGHPKPLHLLFKTFPFHPTRQKLLCDTNLFLKEYYVYSVYIPELINFQKEIGNGKISLNPSVPTLVGGKAIDYTDQDEVSLDEDPMLSNFILMVDERKARGFKMANKIHSLGYHQVKAVLDELAKLHALGYAYKNHKGLETMRSSFEFMTDPFFTNPIQRPTLNVLFDMNFKLVKDALQTFLLENPEISDSINKLEGPDIFPDLIEQFLNPDGMNELEVENLLKRKPQHYFDKDPVKEQWIIPGHGDFWTNNMLFKRDEAGKVTEALLVDLQLMRESCIMTDITYFFYTSTDTEFRERYLDEMLGYYYGKFSEYCKTLKVEPFSEFSLENFKRKFHRSKIFGFGFALLVLPIILMKPVDLDTLERSEDTAGNDNKEESFADMFQQCTRDDDDKKLLRKRFLALLSELHTEGVL